MNNKKDFYEVVPTAVLKLYLTVLEDTHKKQESILKDLQLNINEVKRQILINSEKQRRKGESNAS